MALNPFDDAVEDLPAAPAAQAPAAPVNPYDDIVADHRTAQDARLCTTAVQAATQTPDRAAEARTLGTRFGLPPSVVESNFDAFKQRATAEDVSKVGREAPTLGAWLAASPSNAAVAQDDHAALSALNRTFDFARRAIGDPAISLLKGAIGLPEAAVGLADIVTAGHVGKALEVGRGGWGYQPALAKTILSSYYSKAHQDAARSVSDADGALATAVAALSHPSVIVHGVLESLPLMLGGAAASAALPFAAPVLAGAIGEGALQAGSAAEQSRQQSESGTLTPGQAGLAVSSGVVTGALGVFGGKLAARLGIADVDTLLAGAVVSPTARRGLTTQLLYGAVQEGFLEELPQSISEQVHQNVADGRPLTEGVDEAAVLGAFAGAVMGGGSQAPARFLQTLGETAAASKTIQRSPEAAEAFLAQATKDSPVAHVYAPVDTFTTYWQGLGIDPAEKAAELTGDPAAYPAAVASGEDLAIPTSQYTVQLAATEHHAFFTNELRIAPDQMNVREAQAFETEQAAAMLEPAPISPVRQAVLAQLTAAGVPTAAAEQQATLYESAFGTLAARAGIDPLALYQRYGLTIARPELGTATASTLGTVATPATASAAVAPEASAATATDENTQLREEKRGLQRELDTDEQTGLASGRAWRKAKAAAEADPETSVIVFDANNFGKVNKTRGGHAAGNVVIQQIAAAVKQAATEAGLGERAFRMQEGGDEFIVLAPNALADQIRARAEELFEAQAHTGPEGDFVVSLSGAHAQSFDEADLALQLRKAARKSAVDINETLEDTENRYAPEPLTRQGSGPGGRAGDSGVAASRPRERESPRQRETRRQSHTEAVFADLLVGAQSLDPTIDAARLRAEFDFRLAALAEIQQIEADSGHDPLDLLRAIAAAGGIGPETFEGGYTGEVRLLKEGLKFGSAHGIKVFRTAGRRRAGQAETGLSLDGMLEALQQEPRFAWLENINVLIDAIDNAIRHPVAVADVFPGTDELRAAVQIKRDEEWWRAPWAPELPREFHQDLLDEDTLDTGEVQPRLPGDAGAVRETEVATPTFEAPFALTSESPKALKTPLGRLLFQPLFHGSPHDFAKFDSTKIGSGEGNQTYGHGLYFAQNPDVAESYQREVSRRSSDAIEAKLAGRWAAYTKRLKARRVAVEKLQGPARSDALHQLEFDEAEAKRIANIPKAQLAPKGRLYQVDIPDAAIAQMLDWDAPLIEQSAEIQRALIPIVQASIDAQDTTLTNIDEATGEEAYGALRLHLNPVYVDDPTWRQSAVDASAFLQAAGIPGIKYLDEGSRKNRGAWDNADNETRNVVVFDDAIVTVTHKDGTPVTPAERKEFFQPLTAAEPSPEKRGSLQIDADRQVAITLFARADLSTFLHESAHFFLEVLTDLAATSPAIAADLAALQAAYPDAAHTGPGFSVQQHESLARGFEAYLMEGKAPSVELRSAFSSFRAWLLGVYRSLKALKVTLTPEVRGVFDRMLATDAAIAEAEASGHVAPMFTTAADAGMSESEFARYATTVAAASRTAREALEQQLMAEVRRTQTATWVTQRAAIEATVTEEVHAQPVYRALAAMQRGTRPDGSMFVEGGEREPIKLSKAAIVDQFGKARLATLPKPFVYSAEGGLHPDVVADTFGFSSGDELLTAITEAPPMATAIQMDTDRRMLAAHGSLLLDGTLLEEAQAAVANEGREQVVREELKALNKLKRTVAPFVGDVKAKARGGAATIRRATPSAESLRTAARDRIASMIVKDIRPAVFWSASRKAQQAALDHAARQEFDEAIAAHTQQLTSLALFTEATRVKDDAAARVQQAKDGGTGPARARLGLAGETYLDQYDGILDRYEFAPVSGKVLARRASIRKWIAALEAEGLPVDDLPEEVLNEARRIHYSEIPVAELVGITDGLQMIAHLARLKNKLLKSADAREFAAVRDGVVASIRTHTDTQKMPLEFRAGDSAWRRVGEWFAVHTKIAILARALDGHVDGGAVWDAIIRPLNAAADAEITRKRADGARYQAILEQHFPGRELGTLHDKLFIPALQGSLSKEGRLAVALNWGNQTSRDRLLADPSRQWSVGQVQAILDTLDARDWQFVQDTWDFVNSYWAEIAAKQQRVTGLAPEKVEALAVATRFGELRGGYYPLAYDGRLSARAGQFAAATQATLATSAAYVRTTTKRGHVEARQQNVSLPIRLELGVAFGHLEQVIHDLTHHETLIDVTRLLRDRTLSTAVLETKGDQVYGQFTSALTDIAAGSAPATSLIDRSAQFMRTGTQLSAMGWNLWTAAQQPLGLFNGMSRVGPVWVARGMKRWLRDAASMENTAKWIADRSPMMRARVVTGTQDLHDLGAAIRTPHGWFDDLVRRVSVDTLTQQTIVDSYLWHIGLMQRVADIPTWLGAYEKALASGNVGDDARAIALADQAVLDSQGGGQIKDLAQVQRGGPVAKLFMTFYSYGNTVFNATADRAGATNFRSPASVATFLGHLSLLYVLPALGTVALSRAFGKSGGDEDDPEAFLKDVGQEILSGALNTMVLVRELGGLVQDGTRGYAGPAGARTIELFYNLGKQIKQGEVDEALAKALNQAAGVLFRYPAGQLQRTVDGWVALESGRTKNPAALLFGAPKKVTR